MWINATTPSRLLLSAGALSGVTGVVLGAWGAHGLQSFVGHTNTQSWSTAVTYQLVHALALLTLGVWHRQSGRRAVAWAGWALLAGVVLFSGSIYGLTLGGPRWLGPITPVGGVAFICGWFTILVAAWQDA